MWKVLLSLVTGPLSSISSDLKEAYQSKLAAANAAERIAADERINILEARKSSILAAQSDPIERWVRIGFAFPCLIYVNKILIWDKVLGLGVTDKLSPEFWNVFWVVLGGYFIDVTIRGTARIIKNGRR